MCQAIPGGQLTVKEDILLLCRQKQETVVREVATALCVFLFVLLEKERKKKKQKIFTTATAFAGVRPSTNLYQCHVLISSYVRDYFTTQSAIVFPQCIIRSAVDVFAGTATVENVCYSSDSSVKGITQLH